MTQMTANDRGLMAVARVRGAEEQASRIELERALRRVKEDERELRNREEMILASAPFRAGSSAEFVQQRQSLQHMTQGASEAAQRLEASKRLAAEVHRTWLTRKTRLRAVELLLERREARRREERARRERVELDDLAGQGWLRAQEGRR